MSDYYYTIAVGNRCLLCISPLTREELAEGERPGDGLGYYLYARDETADGLTILAEVGSPDAARQLYLLLSDSRSGASDQAPAPFWGQLGHGFAPPHFAGQRHID